MRSSPWPLLLLVCGCSVFQRTTEDPRPVASLERLKTDPKGVCASLANLSAEPWSVKPREPKISLGDKMLSSTVEACARVKPEGDGPGEGAVVELAFTFPQLDEHWRPEYWHVEVVRQNGLVVLATSLDAGRIEDGVCVLDVCNKEGYATVALPEPWQADRYKIRLIHVPTRKRVDLAITLN